MARNSRLKVCLEIEMRNSSQTHWMRSIKRQRTTPWIAGMGPCSMMACRAARWASVSFEGWPGGLRLTRPPGSLGVELHHPVAHDLNRDPTDPGCFGAGCPLIDRGQRQQPSGLRAILGLTGDRAQGGGVEVSAERNRHGEPPSFATLNQTRRTLKTPTESRPQGLGMSQPSSLLGRLGGAL